jgi:hypothetical protein
MHIACDNNSRSQVKSWRHIFLEEATWCDVLIPPRRFDERNCCSRFYPIHLLLFFHELFPLAHKDKGKYFCLQTEVPLIFFVFMRSCDSSVAVESGCKLNGRDSNPKRGKIVLFSTTPTPALGHTQPIIRWVLGVLSAAEKRTNREAGQSPPSSAEFKIDGALPPCPHISSRHIA